jgi:hypothetical protein
VGSKARELVYALPPEIKLSKAGRPVLDYLAGRANEKDAALHGVYTAYPSEAKGCKDLQIHRATWQRGVRNLQSECGYYLVTVEPRPKDERACLFVLHIQRSDLTPGAILARKQADDERRSGGKRKSKSPPETPTFPELQSETKCDIKKANCDVNTSQFAECLYEIEQNFKQNGEQKPQPTSSQTFGNADDDQKLCEAVAEHYQVPNEIAEAAVYLGIARHFGGKPSVEPIHSLSFFRPIVNEICSRPLPKGYSHYLHMKANEARELGRAWPGPTCAAPP